MRLGLLASSATAVLALACGPLGDGPGQPAPSIVGGPGFASTVPSLAEADDLARSLLDAGLGSGRAYPLLRSLVETAPKRLSGSDGFEDAVDWAEETMRSIGLVRVRREPVQVPRWERGRPERVYLTLDDGGSLELAATALGGSVATPPPGLTAGVVEVDGLEALAGLRDEVRGKIVFFSRAMDPTARATFQAYGRAVGQRVQGPSLAAQAGAAGVVIRSLSTLDDDQPHTGSLRYQEGVPRVPAAALGVRSARELSALLAAGRVKSLTMVLDCRQREDRLSANVVGEIPGGDLAHEVIVAGGHLDAWDTGEGAHDDGAGCVHSLEAARLLLQAGFRPRRTIRIVLFANEENGLRGGEAYAKAHAAERHFFALESDGGGFSPRGISLDLPETVLQRLRPLAGPLAPVGAGALLPGGGGADIGPLKRGGTSVGSLRPDDARYFDLHHSANDTLDAVNPRQLQLGAVVMAYWLAILDRLDDADLEAR